MTGKKAGKTLFKSVSATCSLPAPRRSSPAIASLAARRPLRPLVTPAHAMLALRPLPASAPHAMRRRFRAPAAPLPAVIHHRLASHHRAARRAAPSFTPAPAAPDVTALGPAKFRLLLLTARFSAASIVTETVDKKDSRRDKILVAAGGVARATEAEVYKSLSNWRHGR